MTSNRSYIWYYLTAYPFKRLCSLSAWTYLNYIRNLKARQFPGNSIERQMYSICSRLLKCFCNEGRNYIDAIYMYKDVLIHECLDDWLVLTIVIVIF